MIVGVGTVLIGRYELRERLGSDELGVVYRSRDLALEREVAVRVLRRPLAGDQQLVERFRHDARALADLRDPGIVAVLDVLRLDDGTLAIVLELVPGPSLAKELESGPLPWGRCVDIGSQVCRALAAAHEQEVLHGDLTPDDLLLEASGAVRVAGFGMALLADDEAWARMAGRRPYRAPEQERKEASTPGSDLYGVGAVLFHAATGRSPFSEVEGTGPGRPPSATHSVPDPRASNPSLPDEAAELILRAMAAEPGLRFPSAADLAAALTASIGAAPASSGRPPPAGPEAQLIADDDVQFTVYRPRAVPPGAWRDLLVFAHKTEKSTGPDGKPSDPLEEVQELADQLLGAKRDDYRRTAQDSGAGILRGSGLHIVPEVPGVAFNPPIASLQWVEPVHAQRFRLLADPSLEGTTARGAVSIYCGALLLAEVPLQLRVAREAPDGPAERATTRRFAKVFASYSHRDLDVVRSIEDAYEAVGMEFLRDWRRLRAGDVWNERLRGMIREADVFQLFWSENAMRSTFVQEEWRYALSLRRPNFIKPVYWQDPLPRDEDLGLPPPELSRLHFARLAAVSPAPARPAASAPPAVTPVLTKPAGVPSPARRRRRRTGWGGAILVTAATAAIAVVAATTFLGGGGTADRAGTPDLQSFLPPIVRGTCTPVSGGRARGATEVIRCDVAGLDAYYSSFADRRLMQREQRRFETLLERRGGREVDCQADEPYRAGSLACFVQGGDRYVLWTNRALITFSVLVGPSRTQIQAIAAWRTGRLQP